MTIKYTSGPWQVHGYVVDQPCGYKARDIGPAGIAVCTVNGFSTKSILSDDAEGNSRLIAASPDLKEALQDLLPFAMGYLDYISSLKPAQRDAARDCVMHYKDMPRAKAFVATDAVRNAKAALKRVEG